MWNFAFVLTKLIPFFPSRPFLPFVTTVGSWGHPGVLEQNRLLWRIPGLSLLGSLRFLRAVLEWFHSHLLHLVQIAERSLLVISCGYRRSHFVTLRCHPGCFSPFIPMLELPLECCSLCASVMSSEGLWPYWDLLSSLGSSWSSVWGWVGSASLQVVPLLLQGLLKKFYLLMLEEYNLKSCGGKKWMNSKSR